MPFPPPPAYPVADQEEATPAEQQTEAPVEPTDETQDGEGTMLKNHVYLPKDFPFPKPLKAGDEQKALVTWTYVEDNDAGEHCFKIDTVDGVPITSEAEDKEDEEQEAAMPDTGTAEDPAQEPNEAGTPPSTPNDVTKMILGGK